MQDYRISKLSPEHRERMPDFFDRAFADNPKWSSCYCHCYYVDHDKVDWKSRTAQENRNATSSLIACGQMFGFVAEDDKTVIGWCNAGPRTAYAALRTEPDHYGDTSTTGVILCFLIDPSSRGQGVATALLNAACAGLKSSGFLVAEGYPRSARSRGPENYHGPLNMYLAAGFEIDRDDGDGSVCVRKRL